MKTADSRLRQKMSCSEPELVREDPHVRLLVDELEVDVLERRAPHLDPLELAALRERGRGQLVERPRRLLGLEDDELAVAPVADLGLRARGQLGGPAELDDLAGDEHGDPVGELLGLVEVVRRQEDGLAEPAQRADELPGVAARGGVEAGRRLVEEDELRVADERDRRGRAAASGRRRASSRARRACASRPTSSIVSSTSRGCS